MESKLVHDEAGNVLYGNRGLAEFFRNVDRCIMLLSEDCRPSHHLVMETEDASALMMLSAGTPYLRLGLF